jgi:hypothetical protein
VIDAEIPHPNDLPFRQSRDSAAGRLNDFLERSIAELSKPKVTSAMRGMKRLANLAPTIVASLDTEADQVADRLVASQERAKQAIGQFRGFAESIENTANEVEAALGQLTNDPTQGV